MSELTESSCEVIVFIDDAEEANGGSNRMLGLLEFQTNSLPTSTAVVRQMMIRMTSQHTAVYGCGLDPSKMSVNRQPVVCRVVYSEGSACWDSRYGTFINNIDQSNHGGDGLHRLQWSEKLRWE